MKHIQIKTAIPVFLAFVAFLCGCTKNFDAYNTNPYGLTQEELQRNGVAAGSFIPTLEQSVVYCQSTNDYIYQIQQNLNADMFSGYFAAVNDFGSPNATTYANLTRWGAWPFTVGYQYAMATWRFAEIYAYRGGKPEFAAVANILKVLAMSRVTDVYGPIPYTKFDTSSTTNLSALPYDDQQTIYKAFFADLDNAIAALTAFGNATTTLQNFDLIYGEKLTAGSEINAWIKFANSIKLRLAMRLSYVLPALAQQEAEAAVNSPVGVFTTNDDNAFVSQDKGKIIHNGLWVCVNSYRDERLGAFLESLLKGYNDPRLAKYFAPTSSGGNFTGVRNGLPGPNKSLYDGVASVTAFTEFSPVQLMTAAEVYFLRAEGALWGWNMSGTAQNLYQSGVQASFTEWGIGDATAYLNDDSSSAAPYTDPVESAYNIPKGSSMLPTITIKWNDADNFEKKQERIITQKWLALYPDGEEAWSEFRRTNYPKIFPVASNQSGGSVDSVTQIRRMPYPTSEYQNNGTNVNAAVQLLGGPDNGGTQLWWDKKTHPHS